MRQFAKAIIEIVKVADEQKQDEKFSISYHRPSVDFDAGIIVKACEQHYLPPSTFRLLWDLFFTHNHNVRRSFFLWAKGVIKDNWKTFPVDSVDGQSIYFISDRKNNAVKIGTSQDVPKRLATLQCGTPDYLQVEHVIHSAFPDEEAFLHWRFKEMQIKGEWFRFRPEISSYIKGLVCNHCDEFESETYRAYRLYKDYKDEGVTLDSVSPPAYTHPSISDWKGDSP